MEKQLTAIKWLIVTFICNNDIHIYNDKSLVKPMPPYKVHSSIKDAEEYLKNTRDVEIIRALTF
jgi:hypothetical protein